MIYLIGGPARCGKSTLAKRVRREIDAQVVSADAFTESLLRTLHPDQLPEIFIHQKDSIHELPDNEAKLERIYRRDKAMWKFYEGYMFEVEERQHESLLLEGNLWPDLVSSLSYAYQAVFLIDSSPVDERVAFLTRLRDSKDTSNNWMRDFSDERMRDLAEFNLLRSQRYKSLCEEYKQSFFDIADEGIQAAHDRAFAALLKDAV